MAKTGAKLGKHPFWRTKWLGFGNRPAGRNFNQLIRHFLNAALDTGLAALPAYPAQPVHHHITAFLAIAAKQFYIFNRQI